MPMRNTWNSNWEFVFPIRDRPSHLLMSTDGGPGGWEWVSKGIRLSCDGPAPYTSEECVGILKHIRVDDWVFGVSSVSKDGYESPVASAVPGGAFRPYVAPVERK